MIISRPGQVAITTPTHLRRFGLRFLLLVVAAASVWLAVVSTRARSQNRAVDRVEELGGHVGFDYQLDADMHWRKDPQPPAPERLFERIGEDYARRVVIANFDQESDPTDDDLRVVEQLSDLKQLTLINRKRITDDGLKHLSGIASLNRILLGDQVSEEGRSWLQEHLPNCRVN